MTNYSQRPDEASDPRPPAQTRVRAVVLDHNGATMTGVCVERLLATAPGGVDLEIVVVDNGSDVPVTERMAADPRVAIRRSDDNRGFAGGNNMGLRDLDAVDYVALVNNDVEVGDGWLDPLLEQLREHPSLGAACPKMLFAGRFVRVDLDSPTWTPGRGDRRALGIRVHDVAVEPTPDTAVQFVDGFFGPEDGGPHLGWYQWTAAAAVVHVPLPVDGPMQCTIRASAEFPTVVVARSGDASTTFEVSSTPRDVVVPLAGEPFDVVNNVGSIVRDDGYGLDRGFLEPDRGQYDQPASVAAWCGGAVLLRAEYLRDIGLFDERLFLYYEDLELSLRGASRWQYEYEPRSEVRHRHGATAIHGSARTETLKERNRLVVHSRYAPRRAAARATGRYLLATMSYARRDVAARVLRGRRPSLAIVRRRLAAFAGFVRMRPGRSHPGGGAHNR